MSGGMLDHLSAISLFVEEVQAATRFYQEVFRLAVVYEDDVSAALRLGPVIINLLHVENARELVHPAPVATRGAGVRMQLSIWVDDVDAVCAELRARDVTLLTGPVSKPWGMRVATFADPAGHNWEVAQRLPGS